MKKFLKIFAVVLLSSLMLNACGGDDLEICFHEWEQKVSEDNLYLNATCKEPAQYYSICKSCGAMGAPFAHGSTSNHSYKDIEKKEYKISGATCTSGATYYKSCEFCGKASDETFESTEMLAHHYIEKAAKETHAAAATCEHPNQYYLSCSECGKLSNNTFDFGPTLKHTDKQGDEMCDNCGKPLKVYLDDTPIDNITDKHEFGKN